MKGILKRPLVLIYYGVYACIYVGWLFHRSVDPVIFQYSAKYVPFLVLMTFPFFMPPVVLRYKNRFGNRAFLVLAPLLGVSIVSYLIVSLFWAHSQLRVFDPFVQLAPTSLGEGILKVRSRDAPTFRVVILGGSTSVRYPPFFHEALQDRHKEIDIEVINGAQGEYTTKHSLINYVTYFQDWNPDAVVVMHGINDLMRSSAHPKYAIGAYNDRYAHYYGRTLHAANPPTLEKRLWELLTRTWFSSLRVLKLDYPLDYFVSLRPFKINLTKIVRYARINGATPVVVSQPCLYKEVNTNEELEIMKFGRIAFPSKHNYWHQTYPTNESLRRAMIRVNEIAEDVALENGALFVDAAAKIKRDVQHFRDDCHYRELGLRALGQTIAEAISDAGLVK